MNQKIVIDFWGDITCPFCYIGENLLRRALDKFPYPEMVEVRWRSCLLRPDWEIGKTISWKESMSKLTNPEDIALFEKKTSILRSLSEKLGLGFNLENALSHNSINAARLLKLATQHSMVMPLALAFGKGYFEEAMDMSHLENLKAKALEVGLDATMVEELLNGQQFLDEVLEDQKLAETYAYNYVPTLYFNGGHKLEGLLKEEQIIEALNTSAKELE